MVIKMNYVIKTEIRKDVTKINPYELSVFVSYEDKVFEKRMSNIENEEKYAVKKSEKVYFRFFHLNPFILEIKPYRFFRNKAKINTYMDMRKGKISTEEMYMGNIYPLSFIKENTFVFNEEKKAKEFKEKLLYNLFLFMEKKYEEYRKIQS